MKGCLGKFLWMIIGAVGVFVLLTLLFVVIPSLGKSTPVASRSQHVGEPDVVLTISEAYLNRKVAEVVRERAGSAVTDVRVDLQPGNRALVTLYTTVEIVGVALNPQVDLDVRVGITDHTLQYRIESIKIAKVPVARSLLPGPLKAGIEAVEEEMMRATREEFGKAHFYPVSVKTTDQSLILGLREGVQ